MPFYVAKLTVPANTPAGSPVMARIIPAEGIVTDVQIVIPTNAAGLVGTRLKERGSIFLPAPGSYSQWITGDGETVIASDVEKKLESPPEITIECCSLDDTFSRQIEVRVTVGNLSRIQAQIILIQAINRLAESMSAAWAKLQQRKG